MSNENNNSNHKTNLQIMLRAFKYKNYRLFFAGQGLSLIGTWMQQVAMGWLVYRLTDSAFFLGVIGFASQIPAFLAAPFAGVLADKWSRHKIIIVTQLLAMIQAIVLAALFFFGHVNAWYLVAMSAFLGIINGFDIPTRQAFVYELVDNEEDLPNAIALNSLIFNGARLIGPSIAGILIAAVGEGICFSINAASYLAVLVALLMMKLSHKQTNRHQGQVFSGFKQGLSYAYNFAPIRMILLLLALVALVGMPYSVLMPVFAKDILHGGPRTLGFLSAAAGSGALVGALFLASRRSIHGLDSILVVAVTIFSAGIIAFSFSTILWISLVLMLLAGFGMMVQMASTNTILQTIVDDDKRGRIMSLYTMAFMGMAPIGSLLAGFAAQTFGATHTLQASGCLCIIAAVVFWRKLPIIKEKIRPIYIRKGIIPQVAAGIGTVTQLTMETKE